MMTRSGGGEGFSRPRPPSPSPPPTTHIVSQAVSLVGYGQSGELAQSQLALHGLVCTHDEGLPRSGRESQRLHWEDR